MTMAGGRGWPADLDRELGPAFERWHLVLAPGDVHSTSAEEWAGAFVLIQEGVLQVDCAAGGSETFVAGDQLALGWLPLRILRNAGEGEVRLVAVRPCPDGQPTE